MTRLRTSLLRDGLASRKESAAVSVGESSGLASAMEDRQTRRVDMTRKAKKRVLRDRERRDESKSPIGRLSYFSSFLTKNIAVE